MIKTPIKRFLATSRTKRASVGKEHPQRKAWLAYIATAFIVLTYGWLLSNSGFNWPEPIVFFSNCGFLCLLILSPFFSLAALCIHYLYLDRLPSLELLIIGINLTWFVVLFNIIVPINMLTIFSFAEPILWVLAIVSLVHIVAQKKHRHHALAWAISVHPVAAYSMARFVFAKFF